MESDRLLNQRLSCSHRAALFVSQQTLRDHYGFERCPLVVQCDSLHVEIVGIYTFDRPGGIDEECRPSYGHKHRTSRSRARPRTRDHTKERPVETIRLGRLALGIRQQREREVLLVRKASLLRCGI